MTVTDSPDGLLPDQTQAESFYAKYEPKEVLGTGVSSTVRRCVEKDTSIEFAVKIIDVNSGCDDPQIIKDECRREVSILRLVAGHPYIIELHDVFETDAYIFLVFELCKGGELFDYLTKVVTLSEKRTRALMRQIFDAVRFIHSKGIVHRDLKPENILLDDDLNIKITDMGLAVFDDDEDELVETRGTPGYLAPEVLNVGYNDTAPPYSQPVDLWACGVIMYTLLVGCPPFWNRKEHLMLRQIMQGRYTFHSPEWDDISEPPKDMIRKLLVVDSSQRLTVEGALEHEFFQGQEILVQEFNAKRKFKAAGMSIQFIHRLQKMRTRVPVMSQDQLRGDPYSNRRFRKLIDSVAFDVYSHWVKKGDDQNRAALFESSPKRDLVSSPSSDHHHSVFQI